MFARRGLLLTTACACLGLLILGRSAEAGDAVSVNASKVAIQGYDTVAYFTDGKPVKGDPKFESVWHDAHWHFATAEHRDLFSRQPEAYAPRFGGFCVMAMAVGATARSDPQAWVIIDGKLYLGGGPEDIQDLQKDLAGNLQKAEAGWKGIGQ